MQTEPLCNVYVLNPDRGQFVFADFFDAPTLELLLLANLVKSNHLKLPSDVSFCSFLTQIFRLFPKSRLLDTTFCNMHGRVKVTRFCKTLDFLHKI